MEVSLAALLLWIRWRFFKVKHGLNPETFGSPTIPQLMFVVGLNLVSHPIAWWAWNFLHINYWLVEAAVWAFEGWALSLGFRLNWRQALVASTCLNVASGSIGWLI